MPKPEPERISESTVARIAGNLMSRWIRERRPGEATLPGGTEKAVEEAVRLARSIVAEVERTRP